MEYSDPIALDECDSVQRWREFLLKSQRPQRRLPDTYSPIGMRVSAAGEIVVPQVFVRRVATQPIGGSWEAIIWDTQDVDTANMWDPAQPQRISFPVPGTYAVSAQMWYNAGMPDGTHLAARLNAVGVAPGVLADDQRKAASSGAFDAQGQPVSAIFRSDPNIPTPTLEFEVMQFSGVDRNSRSSIFLRAVYLSP
jgi:hypothetical protein